MTPRPLPPLEICLTVDVEGDVNGAFVDPEGRRPLLREAIWREAGGISHGLGFLLETLRAHRLPATFFLETAQMFCFGPETMGRVSRVILGEDEGHDIQPHLHPAWRFFAHGDWRERIRAGERPQDALADLSPEALDTLLPECRDIFHGMTGRMPSGFRGGNLSVNAHVHPALARAGFSFASCVGRGYFTPREPGLRWSGGVHAVGGVVEVPVSSFRLTPLPWGPWRLLTVAGTPWREMDHLLRQAAALGAGPVVILTHPSEFAEPLDGDGRAYRPREAIQARFRRLCALLAGEPERWRVVGLAQAAQAEPRVAGRVLHGAWQGPWQRRRENG
ncbi:MAG: polysaccharide deacetylase [Magnetococcales bacterium]|nr:polysaccharide deacetylase [Magnetococcales bacterium]